MRSAHYSFTGQGVMHVRTLITYVRRFTIHASNDVYGWNIGGGIEYQFTRNVSLAVQYEHVNLQDNNYRLLNGSQTILSRIYGSILISISSKHD